MFGNPPYYFGLLEKYATLFGTIFSDIEIVRTKDGTNLDQIIKVPIAYAPKDKNLAIITADPKIQRQTSIQLPTMSFEYLSMKYDPTRKLNTLGKRVTNSANNSGQFLQMQFNPVPYNFQFNLYIYVKNTSDGTKIIEQILPFFTPDWTPSVELVPQLNVTMDVPVIMGDVIIEDKYEGNFVDRQVLIYTLAFTMKGYFFGPIKSQPVIKFANTNFYIPDGLSVWDAVGKVPVNDRVTVQPGQLANGAPTSNLALTIPYDNILANSTFGYCVNDYGIILNGNTAANTHAE